MRWRRTIFALTALAFGVVAFLLLAWDLDAATATARWACGSVIDPEHSGWVPASQTTPEAEVFFLQGRVACVEAREARLSEALPLLLMGAIFVVGALRVDREPPGSPVVPAEPGERTSP